MSDDERTPVERAIGRMKAHMAVLEHEYASGEGFWRSDAEKTVRLAEELRDAISRYMGEEK